MRSIFSLQTSEDKKITTPSTKREESHGSTRRKARYNIDNITAIRIIDWGYLYELLQATTSNSIYEASSKKRACPLCNYEHPPLV